MRGKVDFETFKRGADGDHDGKGRITSVSACFVTVATKEN